MSAIKLLNDHIDRWPEEWRVRMARLASNLVGNGWEFDDATKEAEKVCRGEFFRAEMKKVQERVGATQEQRMTRADWTEKNDE